MNSTKHNTFVTKAMFSIGPDLINQGPYSAQLVAVESLFTGMIAFLAEVHGWNQFKAETFMRAVHKGAQDRLKDVIK